MTADELEGMLEAVARGDASPAEVAARLAAGPLREERLPFATLDHHRSLRQGLAEVVLAEGKRIEDLVSVVEALARSGGPVLVTRVGDEAAEALLNTFPDARRSERARTLTVHPPAPLEPAPGAPFVAVVAAGTADIGVAEEVAEVCRVMEVPCRRHYDVGVAGLHRLLERMPEIRRASAVVVVAGMEGALPSVVAGLVSRPVFGVPTSVGYGSGRGGAAALLAMLNSCAPGVAVFNVDNGFSAGVAACRVVLEARRGAPNLAQELRAPGRAPAGRRGGEPR